jgi:hypothetical protein
MQVELIFEEVQVVPSSFLILVFVSAFRTLCFHNQRDSICDILQKN